MAALTACTDAARTANTAASQTKRKGPAGGGTCSLSGYARPLHYDSGQIERIPFFFELNKRGQVYFEGASLGLDDSK